MIKVSQIYVIVLWIVTVCKPTNEQAYKDSYYEEEEEEGYEGAPVAGRAGGSRRGSRRGPRASSILLHLHVGFTAPTSQLTFHCLQYYIVQQTQLSRPGKK